MGKRGETMKQVLTAFVVAVMLTSSAFAFFDIDATKWSVRGNVAAGDVVEVNGEQIDTIYRGKVNAYANLQRGNQTQGMLFFQGNTTDGDRMRFSVNWKHVGRNYGATLVSDTDTETVFDVQARAMMNSNMVYGPATVTYHKDTNEIDIVGIGYSITGVDVIVLWS